MSAESKKRRSLRRLARPIDARFCACRGLCDLSACIRLPGGARFCEACEHVIGKKLVAARLAAVAIAP